MFLQVDSCRRLFFLTVGILLSMRASGEATPPIEGVWVNAAGDGCIELSIADGELRGRIIGSPTDPDNQNPSRRDVSNPDPALRDRPLRGLIILKGFRSTSEGKWTGGFVYDPNSGNTYDGAITLIDADTLKLRGYIGIALFGRTEVWKRRR